MGVRAERTARECRITATNCPAKAKLSPSRSLRADTPCCYGARAAPPQGDNGVTPATFQPDESE